MRIIKKTPYLTLILVFFFIFLLFQVKDPRASSSKSKVLEASLPFVPQTTGNFFSQDENSYYALFEKKMFLLDADFKIKSSLVFARDVSAFDFGDINGDKMDDLIELSVNGIYVRYQMNPAVFGGRTKLPINENLFVPYNAIDLERLSLGYDIDNDSDFDLILPGIGRMFYYENNKSRWVKQKELPFEFKSKFSDRVWKNSDRRSNTITAKSYVPRIYFKDINNDGIIDAFCRVETAIYFYTSRKISATQTKAFANIAIKVFPVELEDVYASFFEVADLDNDGHFELIFSIIKGLGLKIRTEIFVFKGENYLPNPKKKIFYEQPGGFFAPLVVQFKSKPMLIIPTINPGVGFFINYIVRRKLSISAVFLNIVNSKIEEETSVSLSFDVEGNLFPGFTVGDYDNDSYSDFILGHQLKEIEIYRGNDDLDVDSWMTLSLPGYGILKTVKSPSNRDELLIYLPQLIKEYDRKKIYLIRFE